LLSLAEMAQEKAQQLTSFLAFSKQIAEALKFLA
jgi:hypothetical protein